MYTLSADMSLKLTKQNMKSFLNHFLREEEKTNHSNENIDDTKSHLNQTYVFDEKQNRIVLCNSKKQLNEAIENRLSEAVDFSKNGKMTYKNTGKRVRQDAAMCVCTVIQLDPNYYSEHSSDTEKANTDLLVASTEALRQMFGKKNVIALSLHLDETNPHLHAITTPVTDDCRLCKKDFIDKETLKKFHKDIRNNMRKRGYDIDMQRRTARDRLTEQEYKDLKNMIKKELIKENEEMKNQKILQQPETQPSQPETRPSQPETRPSQPETQPSQQEDDELAKKKQQQEEEQQRKKRMLMFAHLQTLQDELAKKKARKDELDTILDDDEGTDDEMIEYQKEYDIINREIIELNTRISMAKKNIENHGKEIQLDERYAPRYSQHTKDYDLSL